MDDFRESLRKALVVRLKVRGALDDDTALFSGGLLDSMSVLELVSLVEELIGKPIPPEDITLDNFDTLACMTRYASRLRETSGAV